MWVGGALALSKRPPIAETLRRTSRQLKSIRKSVAADGYTAELEEIDSLVGVAQQEAERKLSMVENSKAPSSDASGSHSTEETGTVDDR
jgi:hypothetical protein